MDSAEQVCTDKKEEDVHRWTEHLMPAAFNLSNLWGGKGLQRTGFGKVTTLSELWLENCQTTKFNAEEPYKAVHGNMSLAGSPRVSSM